ncbi:MULTISPECIES: hypothetical protein [Sphingobacterium]|uniref:hypothetical protein n=1 Tax=Sphingobacterium TaxID=28453 RepID=UPI0008A1140B|nr:MULTISPECIES: hypothetical protein [Sphingobacterium]OFV21282.1 hypothetical protein HMPREF3127_01305 [Sphingobacterium sp. HMSC13C05]
MRTLKSKFVAGVTALVLLFGAFYLVKASQSSPESIVAPKVLVTQWFEFTGSSSDSPTDPTKYRAIEEGEPMPTCNPGDQVCALKATVDSNGQPIIDSTLQNEIQNATSSQQHSANVRVRD